MEYTVRSLGSFSEMKYGKMPNKKMSSDKGKYPIFSGYRVVGYCDECNIGEQQLVVVARGVGGTGDVKLSPGACFLTNLSIAVSVDESVALKKYLYYYFLKNNLRYLDSGSAQSQITIGDLKNVEVPLPSIETQKKVVSILDAIDEKINNNIAINFYSHRPNISSVISGYKQPSKSAQSIEITGFIEKSKPSQIIFLYTLLPLTA